MRKFLLLSIILTFLFSGMCVNAKVDCSKFLTDEADMLPSMAIESLESILSDIEEQTSIKFAVVTIDSLNGKNIEDVSNDTFTDMGLRKADKDNRLLLLISLSDRKFKLEVGYGLEGVITDSVASRIISVRPL
jgi:uncharacterized protein